jgi:CRP-like cAMP-binding protein
LNLVHFLQKLTLFSEFTDKEVEQVLDYSQLHEIPGDEEVFREGGPSVRFFIVQEGEIAIYKSVGGGQRRILTNLGSGTIFGELALFDDEPRSATACSTSPTNLISFEVKLFRTFLENNPGIATKFQKKIIRTLCQRLRKTNEKLNHAVVWGFTQIVG